MTSVAGDNLRALRRAAGLSQEELAARCGVSERTIRTLESGRTLRPHRDTLRAVADALALPGPAWDTFVSSWRQADLRIDELITGSTPEDALLAEFVHQRSLISERSYSEHAVIDSERRWVTATIRRTFEVVGEGLDRFLWLRGYLPDVIDPERFEVVHCRNIEVARVFDVPAWTARAWEGRLRRELSVGEVYSFEATFDWASAARPDSGDAVDTELLTGLSRPLRTLTTEISFAPDRLPACAWYVEQDSVVGPQRRVRPLDISPFGVVQLHLEPAPAGAHGIAWEWDDPT